MRQNRLQLRQSTFLIAFAYNSFDRYDAVHLLTEVPIAHYFDESRLSPTGMSDLPSDSEDLFFMEEEEAADFQRKKRMQFWENQRQERIRALASQEEDCVDEQHDVEAQMIEREVRA